MGRGQENSNESNMVKNMNARLFIPFAKFASCNTIKGGVKDDGDKQRWDLLPWDALEEVVKVYTAGAKKYADRNWEKGILYSRLSAALLRHLSTFLQGATLNKADFGLHHMAHVVWCALALLTYELREMREYDDRIITKHYKDTPQ